jgi:hypothetical protein
LGDARLKVNLDQMVTRFGGGLSGERDPEVGESASNPQTCTILTPAARARASKAAFMRRTKGISPMRST